MDAIIRWVKNLIFIILITTFLQMFLPENNLRKYVRVVMGFFIISIFISPLAVMLNKDIDSIYFNVLPETKLENRWEDIKQKGENLQDTNRALLREYYADKIKKKVSEIVKLDYPDNEINIGVQVNSEYNIKNINIGIYKNEDIDPVKIETVDLDNGSDKEKGENIRQERFFKLKNRISSAFQISPSIININYYNDGSVQGGN